MLTLIEKAVLSLNIEVTEMKNLNKKEQEEAIRLLQNVSIKMNKQIADGMKWEYEGSLQQEIDYYLLDLNENVV